jgi:hypothetical protein
MKHLSFSLLPRFDPGRRRHFERHAILSEFLHRASPAFAKHFAKRDSVSVEPSTQNQEAVAQEIRQAPGKTTEEMEQTKGEGGGGEEGRGQEKGGGSPPKVVAAPMSTQAPTASSNTYTTNADDSVPWLLRKIVDQLQEQRDELKEQRQELKDQHGELKDQRALLTRMLDATTSNSVKTRKLRLAINSSEREGGAAFSSAPASSRSTAVRMFSSR